MSRLIFDEPAWWQQPQWRLAAAVLATLAAVVIWSAVLDADDPDAPIVPRTAQAVAPAAPPSPPPRSADAMPLPVADPAAPAASAAQAPQASPALSTLVAPGVHVTPLGVPPHVLPAPAGPRDHDSEPEN